MMFELPALPYKDVALAPHISEQTLRIHHGRHHKGYVDKVNDLLKGTGDAPSTLEDVIRSSAGRDDATDLFNAAAQSWNHAFFWQCLAPDGGGVPSGDVLDRIEKDFGGYDDFRAAFKDAATGQFGSGWAWLVWDNGTLAVDATSNAGLPLVDGKTALLTCDVWEHAYYLDYQNARGDFVDVFLDNLVNWEFVARNLELADAGGGQT